MIRHLRVRYLAVCQKPFRTMATQKARLFRTQFFGGSAADYVDRWEDISEVMTVKDSSPDVIRARYSAAFCVKTCYK